MSVVSIFSGAYCLGRQVAREVAQGLGCPLVDDDALLQRVQWRPQTLQGSQAGEVFSNLPLFRRHPGELDRLLSRLRLGISSLLGQENLVYLGYGAHLIPPTVSHVLSVCLIAETRGRLERAVREDGISPEQAAARLQKADEQAEAWVGHLQGREPWSSGIYDILVPMDKQDVASTVSLILEHARSVLLMPNKDSLQAVADFALSARLEAALADQGLPTSELALEVDRGKVTITSRDGATLDSGQEGRIAQVARQVEGVEPTLLEVRLGGQPNTGGAGTGTAYLPPKVFLVDDERDFVQTLSERLQMRQISSLVVYDGRQALELARENEPEVMVLDLKMPGMDGVEVLRRIKRDHPAVEVIILTGHGSERDRELCLDLGAFAFLKKPVDLETLQQTMDEAYRKIKAKRG